MRPLLLPLAVLLAALVVAGARTPEVVAVAAPAALVVPAGQVLVVVQPDDPAVLPLAPPGSRVDVYAPAGFGPLDPLGEGSTAPADLVVRGALVVVPPSAPVGSSDPPLGSVGPVGGALGGTGGALPPGSGGGMGVPGTLTLVVDDDEAAALAARPGGSLLVAVRGSPPPPSSP